MKALPMGHMLAVQLLTCMQQGVEPQALTRCRHQCRVYNTVVLSKCPLPCWVMAEQPQGLCTPLSLSGKARPSPHDARENLPAADLHQLKTNHRGGSQKARLDSSQN